MKHLFAVRAFFLILEAQAAALQGHILRGTPEEQAAVKALRSQKYIGAREQAEKILAKHPNSILARFVLANSFHLEEGNLPRALHHIQTARERLVRDFGKHPTDKLAQHWHRELLLSEETILGEMDLRKQQLSILDQYDALYSPKMDQRRIWPLMKLHRFEEAIRIAKMATLSSEEDTRISGHNGILSIEFERQRPEACFKAAMHALEVTGYNSCVLNANAAETAFSVFKFDQVETLSRQSLKAPIEDCPTSAHSHLANLFLLRGDFQRAISAVKAARELGVSRRLRQQFEMGNTAWLMRLLFALGKFEETLKLAEQAARSPDRVGMISFSKELLLAISTVELHAAILARIEQLRERASARQFLERIGIWAKIQQLELVAWETKHRASHLLANENTLVGIVRPYFKPLAPWRTPALIQVVGRGILKRAVAQATAKETMKAQTASYFDGLLGEIAFQGHDFALALKLANQSLAKLPKDETLLHNHIAAWAAYAAWKIGQWETAQNYFHQVLHSWPTALRILSIPLPVEISSSSDVLAKQIAAKLRDSPRLIEERPNHKLGFRVQVVRKDNYMQTCLSGIRGHQYACTLTALNGSTKLSPDELTAKIIDEFCEQVFAPKIDLTQQDINSLDGSAVRGHVDTVLREVLGK
ncbi:MAG: hypothetical protein V1754_07400 [Pseudomonadota bacterium]